MRPEHKKRRELVASFGGQCSRCGYSRCVRALQFHHEDASEKKLWSGKHGRASVAEISAHPDRFRLLCANCHIEEHEEINERNSFRANCFACHKEFKTDRYKAKAGARLYCGYKCRDRHRRKVAVEDGPTTRFWEHVTMMGDGHWTWTGSFSGETPVVAITNRDGSPGVRTAARFCWELHNGAIGDPEMKVIRTCDNPACVNPDHLILGTSHDKMRICSERGNTTRGEKSASAKITEAQVVEIRRRYGEGNVTQSQLAAEFGMSQGSVGDIVRKRRWAHVP